MNNKLHRSTRGMCRAAIIAALYVVLTLISSAFGLASGAIQLRISEMLCVLPVFMPSAIPGLTVGCFIANLVCGGAWLDVIFGSLATLLGALGAYALRHLPYAAAIPTILANVVIMTPVLVLVYRVETVWYLAAAGVAVGEVVCCGILGTALTATIRGRRIFGNNVVK